MARLARLYAPMGVQHAVQRPAAGRALFVDDESYESFSALLAEAVRTHGIALHAYALMPGEIRLLATPADATALGQAFQSIGRRYVPWINRRTGLTGPLWSRRFRSTLIDATYLIESMRFIEARPVTGGWVASPEQWRWSSYLHHVGREQQASISDHARYWALGNTPFERQATYRARFDEPIAESLEQRIAETVERGWVLGAAAVAGSGGPFNRRSEPLPRGRPRRRSK